MVFNKNSDDKKDAAGMVAGQSFGFPVNKSPESRKAGGEPRDSILEANVKYTIQDMQWHIEKILAHHPDVRQHVNTSALATPSKMSVTALIALKHQVEAASNIAHTEHAEEHAEKSVVKSAAELFDGKLMRRPEKPLVSFKVVPGDIPLAKLGDLQAQNLNNAMKIADIGKIIATIA